MRKGARRVDWTTDEVRELVRLAGKVPKREICRRLKRSAKSVERKAARLRAEGVRIDLRSFVSAMSICPSCGHASALIGLSLIHI